MPIKHARPVSGKKTRDAVIHSALKLFNMGGYDGTSVRAIAADAGVNVALVSYYFGGKQGLLEFLMASFYEGYLDTLDTARGDSVKKGERIDRRLVSIADALIRYQQRYFYLSRFVHREMTLDNQLVRELMASYLMKEKYLLEQLFKSEDDAPVQNPEATDFIVLQYRDMIVTPFLQPQLLRKVYYLKPSEPQFRINYLRHVRKWAERFARPAPDVSQETRCSR